MPPLFPDIDGDEAFAAWRRQPSGWLAAVREIAGLAGTPRIAIPEIVAVGEIDGWRAPVHPVSRR